MTYYNGIISNDAGASETLRGVLRTGMDAHADWAFVETVTISTYNYDVYRSLGASNGISADYFVIARYPVTPATNIAIVMTMCEEYDAVNHVAAKVAPVSSSTFTPDATGGFNTSTSLALNSGIFHTNTSLSMNSTLVEYYLSITTKRVVFVTRVGTTPTGVYAGQFSSYYSGDTMPLVLGNCVTNVAGGAGAFTRNWARLGLSTASAFGTATYLGVAQLTNYFASVGTAPDFYSEGKWTFSPAVVAAASNTQGGTRGQLYDVVMPYGTSGIAVGDTVTIDGQVHVFIGYNYWLNTAV